jgi:CMP-N,N'-diacetyllegionaminic acid synthase
MEQLNRVLCTICMRGGSKGVRNKNLRELNGKPLLAYTIEQALSCNLFEHVVVSTDSTKIAENSKRYGAEAWFLRPSELATDKAAKIPAIRHALLESENYYGKKFDVLVDLDVTSPLRSVNDIKGAYLQFVKENADILITACPARKNPYFNMVEMVNDRIQKVREINPPPVRRQDAPNVYDMNASIYIWKRKALLECDTLFTEKTTLYTMLEERSLDIDTELDWEFMEFITEKLKAKND